MLDGSTVWGGPKTYELIGSGTLWTTGQVGNFVKTNYLLITSLWRTGYDNRNASGIGNIQLVTPTLTHLRSSDGYTAYNMAQIGLLTIRVPEPGAMLLLAAGVGVLAVLRRVSRRS